MAQSAPWREFIGLVLVAPLLLPFGGPAPPGVASALTFADLRPDGGEVLPSDTVVPIAWNATHDGDTWFWATLSYAADGGAGGFITRGDFPLANGTYPWRVPRWNTTAARVRVCGIAPDGDAACRESAGDFTILATPPYMDLLSPADEAMNVPLDALLVFGMENVSTASVSWSITPAVGAWSAVWSNGDRVLTLMQLMPFASCTRYSVTAQGQGDDGTPLGPYAWRFTTTCPPALLDFRVLDPIHGPILVQFGRPMNRSSVQWTITPSVPLTPVWQGHNTELLLYPSPRFSECTAYRVVLGTAMDMDGNDWYTGGPTPNPFTFVTECTYPWVRATNPSHGQADVPLADPIVIDFSEDMDPAMVQWMITPSLAGVSGNWTNGTQRLTLSHATDFAKCEQYEVIVGGTDLARLGLVPGPVPNPWSFTTVCPPVPPVITNLQPVAPDTVRIWIFQEWTSPDFFRVYETEDRFAPWPWPVLGETTNDVFDAVGHLTDGETHFYIVRGVYGARESGNSSIAVKADLAFAYKASSTNIFYVSLPYGSPFMPPMPARGIVAGLTDPVDGPPIDIVGTWDPPANRSVYYVHFRGEWRGTDFPIHGGDGIWLGAVRSFHWILLSSEDANVPLNFTAGRERWISLPYTSAYRTASDVVRELEGSLGPTANTNVTEIAMWDGATQSLRRFAWTPSGWAGDDFVLAPGTAVRLRTPGSFVWTPRVVGRP